MLELNALTRPELSFALLMGLSLYFYNFRYFLICGDKFYRCTMESSRISKPCHEGCCLISPTSEECSGNKAGHRHVCVCVLSLVCVCVLAISCVCARSPSCVCACSLSLVHIHTLLHLYFVQIFVLI